MHPCASLADEVSTGYAAIDDTVLHVFRDVRSADEEYFDRRVSTCERQCTLSWSLGPETRLLEERERRFAQPSLDGDGDLQVFCGLAARRSIARR